LKIIYLDQLHWIEIAKHINGKKTKEGTEDALNHILKLSANSEVVFPLSFSHYYETLKQANPGKRQRLAKVMRQISQGYTVSALGKVVRHEVREALISLFDIDCQETEFLYIGKGFEHAFGRALNMKLKWPNSDLISPSIKEKLENDIFGIVEDTLLSGVIDEKCVKHLFSNIDLTPNDTFKKHLSLWKGCASKMSPSKLSREIYAITYQDIFEPIFEQIVDLGIPQKQFINIGENGIKRLLDMMPYRRVDMHLREQWAKNGDLHSLT